MLQVCSNGNFAAIYWPGQYPTAGTSSAAVQWLLYCNNGEVSSWSLIDLREFWPGGAAGAGLQLLEFL